MKQAILKLIIAGLIILSPFPISWAQDKPAEKSIDSQIEELEAMKAKLDEEILTLVHAFNERRDLFLKAVQEELKEHIPPLRHLRQALELSDETKTLIQEYANTYKTIQQIIEEQGIGTREQEWEFPHGRPALRAVDTFYQPKIILRIPMKPTDDSEACRPAIPSHADRPSERSDAGRYFDLFHNLILFKLFLL